LLSVHTTVLIPRVMEIRVECLEGSNMPAGCYVGVRVGDILKQGRYEPQRCYNFPMIERRRNAKIDVYQHVGTCTVGVDPDARSMHEVNVQSTDGSSSNMKLKVNVQSTACDLGAEKQRETRTKALKNQAKDYLSKYSVEEKLSEAVKALLKEQPADPTDFICRHLRGEENPAATAAVKLPGVMLGPSSPSNKASPVHLPPGTHSKAMASAKPIVSAPSRKPSQLLPFKEYYKTHVVQVKSNVLFEKLYKGFSARASSEPVSQAPIVADDSQLHNQGQDVRLQAHVLPRVPDVAQAKLKVKIVGAAGLRDADWFGTSDPYCVCRLPRKPDFNFRTQVVSGNLNPEWNEEFVEDFVSGDTLEFAIFDSDACKTDELLGRVTLKSDVFLQKGFQGALPLSDAGGKGAVNVMIEVMSEIPKQAPMVAHISQQAISQLRQQARQFLLQGSVDGTLNQALVDLNGRADYRLRPSVGTWFARLPPSAAAVGE